MTRVVRLHRFGGPEVLIAEEAPDVAPGAGEIRIRQTAIGVNFTDVHGRRGDYANLRSLPMPIAIGMEGLGVVEAVAPDVTRFHLGDRVAYASAPLGSYASHRNMPALRCVRVPSGLSDEIVAASLLKGMEPETIDLPTALRVLSLPRTLGQHHRVKGIRIVKFHAFESRPRGGVETIGKSRLRE